jgi:hypothetical protein
MKGKVVCEDTNHGGKSNQLNDTIACDRETLKQVQGDAYHFRHAELDSASILMRIAHLTYSVYSRYYL